MRNLTAPHAGSTVVGTLAPAQGGTGSTTAQSAITNLGILSRQALGAPNGVATLNLEGKLPGSMIPEGSVSTIALDGPTSITKGQLATFVITNYDVFTDYKISVSQGSLQRTKDTIVYKSPTVPQNVNLNINGKVFQIEVSNFRPDAPILAVTHQGGIGNTASIVIQGSDFNIPFSPDTHLNTDWQTASDVNFTNIVQQSLNNNVNKQSISFDNIALGTTLFVRARYRSSSSFTGRYSATTTINTKTARDEYLPAKQQALLFSNTLNETDNTSYGSSCAISGDGTRAVVGDASMAGTGPLAGGFYVFVRSGSTWSLEQKVVVPNSASNDYKYAGSDVDIDSTGTRIVTGGWNSGNAGFTNGTIYVYSRSGSIWTLEATINNPNPHANGGGNMGSSVSITAAGDRIVTSAPYQNFNSFGPRGAVFVFVRSGATWSSEAFIFDTSAGNVFGWSTAIDATGGRIAIGQPTATGNKVHIYTRSGSTWAREAIITPVDVISTSAFGQSVSLNAAGDTVAMSTNSAVYIFKRSGSTWAQQSKLVAPDIVKHTSYGQNVCIDNTGNKLAVLCNNTVNSGLTTHLYIFKNNQWNLELSIDTAAASSRQSVSREGSLIDFSDNANFMMVCSDRFNPSVVSQISSAYVYVS